MDEAERIPIHIGYEVASEAAAEPSDVRTTVREDGAVLIDILAPQPCQPEPSTGDEIVVCAATPGERATPVAPPPPSPTAMETLQEALNVKVGPVEIGSIAKGDGTRIFGARIRF